MGFAAITQALKGVRGEFEVQRILQALGTVVYIVTAPMLVWTGKVQVTFETFCQAYPLGLAACLVGGAGAIAIKDRNVAKAQAT